MEPLAHGHAPTMADTSLNQTAAPETNPAAKPAVSTGTKPAEIVTPLTELDLDSLLDEELDADLPRPKSKEDKKATPAKKKEETDTDAETETDEVEETEEEEESETPDGTETETEGVDDTETEDPEIGDDDEVDPEKPPKGFENVPKGIWKRQNKLIQKQRELKSQIAKGPFQITPTPESPLADVESVEVLDNRIATAKQVRKWCQENPEGGTLKGSNGREVELTPDQVQNRLALAEAVIEAAPDMKVMLSQREQEKPWEIAESITPGLFEDGTPEYQFMKDLVSKVPHIKHHPAWEVIVAAAAKGMRQTVEERTGKAKYVRYELDKDGKLIAPKKKAQGNGKTDKASPAKPKPPSTPEASRPAITRTPQKSGNRPAQRPSSDGDSDVAAMLADELGDF